MTNDEELNGMWIDEDEDGDETCPVARLDPYDFLVIATTLTKNLAAAISVAAATTNYIIKAHANYRRANINARANLGAYIESLPTTD